MKTGSPTLGFQHPAASIPQLPPAQPPLQRAAIQRQQARRSGQNFLPKLAPGQSNQDMSFQGISSGHPTPSSHASSPTSQMTRSPTMMQQGGSTPPASAVLAQPQQQQYQNIPRSSQPPPNQAFYQQRQQQMSPTAQRPGPPPHYQSNASVVSSHSTGSRHSLNPPMSNPAPSGSGSAGPSAAQYYPSPFQNHIDKLGKFTPSLSYRTVFVLD